MDTMQPVNIAPASTSYFSQPAPSLDPSLFTGDRLKDGVRQSLLSLLYGWLEQHYAAPNTWATAWIAGSGVSYQWRAARTPGDLDVLVGIDYTQFRLTNSRYQGLSDTEISQMINEGFRQELQPRTTNWRGFEVTFYVNPHATDISVIKPYAAYNITSHSWTVPPQYRTPPENAAWKTRVERMHSQAVDIVQRYGQALDSVRAASNPAARLNAEVGVRLAMDQAAALFDTVHHGRRHAFSPSGQGYDDWHNYAWQALKASGAVGALQQMKHYRDLAAAERHQETYGMELPSHDVLVRRAALWRAQ